MARITQTDWIWRDGEMIRWEDATVHVLSLAVQFGSSVFEGIRCYETPNGPAIFRLDEHLRRLEDSCRIYRIAVGFTRDDLAAACAEVVSRNRLSACYIRPTVLRGFGAAAMDGTESPIQTVIAAWPWGAYLGQEALEEGVDVCVSSWQRPEPNTFPSAAKGAGHYNNATLIKLEAMINGYVEAIALGPGGVVSEGSGQNVFLVRDGVIITPRTDGTLLPGITRASVITIAEDLEMTVREESVPREALYTADELFFAGTATEVTPIRSVDRITVGRGRAGPVTKELQRRFLAIARGTAPDVHAWLTLVEVAAELAKP